jgi:hypothetical protein
MSRRLLLLALPLVLAAGAPAFGAAKGMRLWNLTGETLDRVELAPAGTLKWGRNQCANDDDGTVDFDEELPIRGVKPGRYDVRVRDVHGKTCIARNVEVKAKASFAVHEKDLADCTP